MLSWECDNCGFINLSDEANCLRCRASAFDDMAALAIVIEVEEDDGPPAQGEAPYEPTLTVSRRRFLPI
jgi:hypothetical protein